nr:reverse transcriptase domain-containing protein [Tanacetum cinerariifolium]
DLLRQCPHHGFSELHQLDTFYKALNPNDQDALDSTAGGNFMDKIPRECLSIIESKSKVRYSRSRIIDSRANTNAPLSSSLPSNSFDLQQITASLEDKLDIRMNRFEKSLNDMKNSFVTPTAPIKAIEEHPEDLVPAEGEAPTSLLPPGFLSPRIRPQSPRALEAEMNAIGSSLYRSLHPSGTPPGLPISTPSTSRRARIPEADTAPRSRPPLTTPRPGCEVGESFTAATRRQGPTMAHGVDCSYIETRLQDTKRRMMAALKLVNRRVSYQVEVCTRESSEFCTRHHDAQKDRAAVRAEIEVLRNERLAYEQEVLETHARRLEWQRQAADDFAVEHIMRTQALETGAHIDTLEDTGSSS